MIPLSLTAQGLNTEALEESVGTGHVWHIATFFSLLESGCISIIISQVDGRSSQCWHCSQAQCQDLVDLCSSGCRFLLVILEVVR